MYAHKLPAKNGFSESFKFLTTKRFSQNVCPVMVSVYLDHFNVTILNLITKMIPFDGNMFCVGVLVLLKGSSKGRVIRPYCHNSRMRWHIGNSSLVAIKRAMYSLSVVLKAISV